MLRFDFEKRENILEKGENAGNQDFIPFLFSKNKTTLPRSCQNSLLFGRCWYEQLFVPFIYSVPKKVCTF